MKTFKVLAALLGYPEPELIAALPELVAALTDEDLVPQRARAGVSRLIDDLAAADLYDAQERYVALFDRTRALSLHLFEHIHGESRDRGQAMVDLATMYRLHGLEIGVGELPDYLPLFLEFLGELPEHAARSMLAEASHVIAALGQRLAERDSRYAGLFEALTALAKPDAAAVAALLERPVADPEDLAALDRDWEESAVQFAGAPAPGCAGTASPTQPVAAR
ncbi:MAG: nitrate reductase molybdenum cofactor assembly chaperone [Proteobacteria bacterium]|nr:nitrate reductase molybdenum cofactor assembly chaperone [Pseudomonadota bacterium]